MNKMNLIFSLLMLTSVSAFADAAQDSTATTHECVTASVATAQQPCTPPAPKPQSRKIVRQAAPVQKPAPIVQKQTEQPIVIERKDNSPIIIHNHNNNVNNNIIDSYDDDEDGQVIHHKHKQPKKKVQPKKRVNSDISVYGHAGFFTRISSVELEAEARASHFGIGLFYSHLSARNLANNCGILSGDQVGLDLHYHFTAFNDVHNYQKLDPGLYLEGAFGRYNMLYDDSIFSGLMLGAGLDVAYPVTRNVNVYGKAGVNYLRYQSDFYYAGESLTFGIRYDF